MSFISDLWSSFVGKTDHYPDNAVFMDVRNTSEYANGVIEDAILLPLNDVKNKSAQLLSNKHIPIVVYCASGVRSAKAKNIMTKLGYTKVINGINAKQVSRISGKKIVRPTRF